MKMSGYCFQLFLLFSFDGVEIMGKTKSCLGLAVDIMSQGIWISFCKFKSSYYIYLKLL